MRLANYKLFLVKWSWFGTKFVNLKPPQRTRGHQTNSKITGCTQTIVSYKTVSTQTDQDDQHINADTFTKHVEDEDDNYTDGDDDDDNYQPTTYDEVQPMMKQWLRSSTDELQI
jgi:hypothetical protein